MPPPTCMFYFLISTGTRIQPSFPLELQPNFIFFYLRSSSCFHQTYRLFSKHLRACSPLPPFPTLIASFSVKLTSNWSPCFWPSYSALKQPFWNENPLSLPYQLSPCLQTDVHTQHNPEDRPLTQCYSRWAMVGPCHPLHRSLHPSHANRAPSPKPALPQGLGPLFKFPASTHNEGGIPAFFTWQNETSPRHPRWAAPHILHLFNFIVSVETAALHPQAEGLLPSPCPQHSTQCPGLQECRPRGCRGLCTAGPGPPKPICPLQGLTMPGTQQKVHTRMRNTAGSNLAGCFRLIKCLTWHYFSNYWFVSQSWESVFFP